MADHLAPVYAQWPIDVVDASGVHLHTRDGRRILDLYGGHAVAVRGPLHANNGWVLAQAAVAGMGLVYGPRFFVDRALAEGRLVELDLGADLYDLGAIHAVTHPTRRPAAKTRAWIDFLAERLPGMAREW